MTEEERERLFCRVLIPQMRFFRSLRTPPHADVGFIHPNYLKETPVSNGACSPKGPAQLTQEITEINTVAQSLASGVDELETRLNGVLTRVDDGPGQTTTSPPEQELVPHAAEVRVARRVLERAQARVRLMLSRLEC
jgi:hypothetical protein